MARNKRQIIAAIATPLSVLIVIVMGVLIANAMDRAVKKLPIREYFPKNQINAIWDWSNVRKYTDHELSETADFLYIHQINTVFLDIGSVGSASFLDKKNITTSLERYIAAMQKHGIKVYAAAGNTEWSKPELQKVPLRIQKYVFDYNSRHEQKLAGIEIDVEAYNQKHFPEASFTEKELVLNEYLDMAEKLVDAHLNYLKKSNDKKLELGFAIPYWFDNENKNIKSVTWQNKTGPVLFHLLDMLNSLPHTNTVVMAYRDAAGGNDGIIYHSRTEVDYAQSKAPKVNILIGIEVNNVEPTKITFYGQTFTEVSSEVKLLPQGFDNANSYKGIAINDLLGYKALTQN